MSIRVMSRIWDQSPAKGVELLIELALGDFADDSGRCWPSIAALARKSRASETHVHRTINALIAAHRLDVDPQAGPHGCNLYTIKGGAAMAGGATAAGVPILKQGGAIRLIEMAPDPSIDPPKDPSPIAKEKKARIVKEFKPSEQERALYTEKFPGADVDFELERFNSYQLAHHHGYADHHQGFLNWLRSPYRESGTAPTRNATRRSAGVAPARNRAEEARRALAR